MERSSLEPDQQGAAMKASLHWLRHTHATPFAERGVDLDVLLANRGHSGTRTLERRLATTGRSERVDQRRLISVLFAD